MIKLIPTGSISKNANQELCLDTKFTVTIDVADVTYANINEKIAELISEAQKVKQVIELAIIKSN
jgi:ACT domain-containing protein